MAELYFEPGYVECGYVEGNSQIASAEVHPEQVQIFGFSKKEVFISKNLEESEEIRREYSKRYGRKTIIHPEQTLQSDIPSDIC